MKKYIFSLALFAIAVSGRTQDFNLFIPSNEMYLFSAYDEGANGYRLNPAVLGLKHRFNLSLNAFLENTRNDARLNEIDLSANFGILGLSYRYSFPYGGRTTSLGSFSIGAGFGNKTMSGGLLYELNNISTESSLSNFNNKKETKSKVGIGLLFRPTDFLSTSVVIKTGESLLKTKNTSVKYTFGAAIRPLRNDMITFLLDFSLTPYYNAGVFDNNSLKTGIEFKAMNGIYVNANYFLVNSPEQSFFLNFGLRFDLPHTSFRYNNTFTRLNESGFYDEDSPIKSQGNHISLTYSSERRESIVPVKGKILEISLSGSLQDFTTQDVLFGVLGEGKRSIHEVIADIDYASADPAVKGILLKIYPLSSGWFDVNAQTEELTAAMKRFRARRKTITAYFPEEAGPGEYYIATFTDRIVLPEEATFSYGLSITVMNFKQFLQKYGIELQTFYAGKYKLTFQGLLDSTTGEGKEVIERMLDIVYDKMITRVQESRNITVDDYMRTKLSQPITGREALRLNLVDALGWYQDAKDIAEKISKTKGYIRDYNRSEWENVWSEPDRIAVVGVYGTITPGESEAPSPFPIPFISSGRSTGSESVVRQLENAFSDPKVKAVILRINSGGGSALASAEINDAVKKLKKKHKKPFFVSMGRTAASGGYYVSLSGDKIFCDELTLTGSIGVLGAFPNLDSLLDQQKIKVETFKRGEHSDIGSIHRKLTSEEVEIIQGLIDFYYDRFIDEISKGRNLTKEEIEDVAQGRVWLGTDAFNKRLIDELGGLYETIKYASKAAKIGKRFKIVYYAVPGGEIITNIVTSSIISYLQSNITRLLGIDGEDNIEIRY